MSKYLFIDEDGDITKGEVTAEEQLDLAYYGTLNIICIDPIDENYLKNYYQGKWHDISEHKTW